MSSGRKAVYVSGTDGALMKLDPLADAVITHDILHTNVHNGLVYSNGQYDESIADDGVLEFLYIAAAGAYTHLRFAASSEGSSLFQIFEGPTVTDNGSEVTPYNLNFNSGDNLLSAIYTGPTTSGDGTKKFEEYHPTNNFTSVASDFKASEVVLKPDTTYLIRLKNLAGNAKGMNLQLFYYERTKNVQ